MVTDKMQIAMSYRKEKRKILLVGPGGIVSESRRPIPCLNTGILYVVCSSRHIVQVGDG